MQKRTYLSGGIIALAFLWTGSAFISLAYQLLEFYSPVQLDLYQVAVGYLLQVAGMALFAFGTRSYSQLFLQRFFFAAVLVLEALVITAGILASSAFSTLLASFIMNLLHGVVAGSYLTLLTVFVPQQYRGRVFGFAYALGSVGSWLLSLPFKGTFLKMDGIVLVYLLLIALTFFLHSKIKDEELATIELALLGGFDLKELKAMFLVLVLLSLVKTIGFYFPVADISGVINLEFSRAFYALGLVTAGIINDKNRRIGAVCCIAALSFSFISFALNSNAGYATAVWILGYIFFGFFSVYRVVVFADFAAKQMFLLPLAAGGLMAGRIGDALGTLGGMLLSGNTIALVVITSSLFIVVVFLFFSLYQKLYTPLPLESINMEKLYEEFAQAYAFTMRESEVFRLVVQGCSNIEISGALYVAESTVKFHVGNILKKASCVNRTELTLLFKNKGLRRNY